MNNIEHGTVRPPYKRAMPLKFSVVVCLLSVSLMRVAAAERLSAPGITEPILDSTLGTPVAGTLMARRHQEGDFVKKGEIVVELDKRLEDLEVARREVVLEPLKADYEANRTLFEKPKSSVSKEILDKKLADYRVAQAEFELAREQAQKRLIVAPFDGTVTELFLQVGEACQIQQPIARMVDTRRCYFIAHVDSKSGYSLRVGQTVELEVEAGAASTLLSGTINFVSPVVDPASGLMKVRAVFENAEGKIRPGVAGKMYFQEAVDASARK